MCLDCITEAWTLPVIENKTIMLIIRSIMLIYVTCGTKYPSIHVAYT